MYQFKHYFNDESVQIFVSKKLFLLSQGYLFVIFMTMRAYIIFIVVSL